MEEEKKKEEVPSVPFEEDEYVQFARERMASLTSIQRSYAKRRSVRSYLFTIVTVIIFIVLYNMYFKSPPPPPPPVSSPSITHGGKKFVPLDTFHLAPNVDVK
jgi:hypothetical protein